MYFSKKSFLEFLKRKLCKQMEYAYLYANSIFRAMYSKQVFNIWIDISLFIGCLVETRNYSILSLAFIAISFRVTEENLVFETVQSGPYCSFECFSAL